MIGEDLVNQAGNCDQVTGVASVAAGTPHHEVYGHQIMGSAAIDKLAAALSACQTAMSHAAKDSKNPHLKNTYADLASCWEAARPHLHGLSVTQTLSSRGKTAIITTLLMHSSGQWLSSTLELESKDGTPQAMGTAFTYGRRYAFCAALGITADDDDGNASSGTGRPIGKMDREDAPFSAQLEETRKPATKLYRGTENEWQTLQKYLVHKKVDPNFHEQIALRLIGRPPEDTNQVIMEVLKDA